MAMENSKLHIFFLPFAAYGHMIPALDLAKLFAWRGVKTTILTTPLNLPVFSKTIQKSNNSGAQINLLTVKFPAAEAGLPEQCENVDWIISQDLGFDASAKFMHAIAMLQPQVEQLLQQHKPNCLIADLFFPWATDASTKFGIPRIVFHGTSFFSMCTSECVHLYQPHKKVSSDSEIFVVPYLPGEIKLTGKQLEDHERAKEKMTAKEVEDQKRAKEDETVFMKMVEKMKEAESKSFGTVVNSFFELEKDYVDFYRNKMKKRAWHVGPVSLCNKDTQDKVMRGQEAAINETDCLKWLNSKKPNSVIYICFGSVAKFGSFQLKEIAMGIEASGQQFIWVVRKEQQQWLPEGFENRIEGKGLIIKGWAPQVLILEHVAVGAFVTHCGWNSILEGVTAGKPFVTWPVSAEQFYNEKLVTQVLRIGVSVGVKEWVWLYGDGVESGAVEKAVSEVMVGEEAEEMRNRARVLGELARKAVEEGGSSHSDLGNLIEELKGIHS